MKKYCGGAQSYRRQRASIFFAIGLLVTNDHQSHAQDRAPQVVSGPELSMMIRNAVIAVHHANITGNYTVLRDLSARHLREEFTAAGFADLFRTLREQDITLAGTVLLDPVLQNPPKLSSDGILHLKGYFDSRPDRVYFDLLFLHENERWLIADIGIGVR